MQPQEFFFFSQNLYENLGMIEIVGHTPVTADFKWTTGAKFDRPVPKETLLLDPNYGSKFPDFFDTTVPVMSERLVAALRTVGIQNFDAYPVTLQNKTTGETFEGYFAVNLYGCVDAVNAEESPHRLRFGKPHFTGKIVIDPEKVGDWQAFRLRYGPSLIVVTQRIADALRPQNFQAVLFQPTTAYQGA